MIEKSLKLQPVTEEPYNAETPLSALGHDLTPTNLFYVRNHFEVPTLDADQFVLRVNSAVANPLKMSLEELKEYPGRNLSVVMECAGNGRASMNPPIKGTPWNFGAISVANFSGIRLHQILELAGYSENGCEVLFAGADQGVIRSGEIEPYARSLPMEMALHEDTILAWQMNGEPLPLQHGFPLRLVVPGWYGMTAVKWLREITVLTKPFEGFFQTKEYVYSSEKGIPITLR